MNLSITVYSVTLYVNLLYFVIQLSERFLNNKSVFITETRGPSQLNKTLLSCFSRRMLMRVKTKELSERKGCS